MIMDLVMMNHHHQMQTKIPKIQEIILVGKTNQIIINIKCQKQGINMM